MVTYKEFKGYEFEFKFLIDKGGYSKVIREIYRLFKNKKVENFLVDDTWQNDKNIKPRWKKKIIPKYGIYYFYGGLAGKRVINEIILLRKNKLFRIKKKLTDKKNCSDDKLSEFIKKRLEVKGKYLSYNKKNTNKILSDLEKVIKRKLFLVGVNHRKRLMFYVYNIKTKRAYGVSVDQNRSQYNQIMQQLEIEYRGIHTKPKGNGEGVILNDILFLAKNLKKNLNSSITLKPTKLTKFEWLLEQYKENY